MANEYDYDDYRRSRYERDYDQPYYRSQSGGYEAMKSRITEPKRRTALRLWPQWFLRRAVPARTPRQVLQRALRRLRLRPL